MSEASLATQVGQAPKDGPPAGRATGHQGSLRRSLGQLSVTLVLFVLLWVGMLFSLEFSYALTLALAVPTAGLVVRLFIFQHDCGHGSFFANRRANDAVGWLCCLATLTPYANWRRQHAQHHANWNNLDRRDSGIDIYSTCLTTTEYEQLSPGGRLQYRMLQNPLISLLILPPLVFLLIYRFPFDTPAGWKRERRSVHLTNLALAVTYGGLGFWIGFGPLVMVQAPVTILAAIIGVWLFSVQHKFENTLWLRGRDWNARDAAVQGSSYLRLPKILQWFTGNIGFHHVHHFDPRIPNYRLEEVHQSMDMFQATPILDLRSAVLSHRYCLWDEQRQRMVRIGERSQAGA